MSRAIKHVKVHSHEIFIPGEGPVSSSLPPSGRTMDLSMKSSPEGVVVVTKGIESVIPWTNIVLFQWADEVKTEAKSKK